MEKIQAGLNFFCLFAKPIAKMFDSAKVTGGQGVIQCTHKGKCRSIDIKEEFRKFGYCHFVE